MWNVWILPKLYEFFLYKTPPESFEQRIWALGKSCTCKYVTSRGH